VDMVNHRPEPLFAIEVESSSVDLTQSLAIYRRLNDAQKAVAAAELRRRVELEIEAGRKALRRTDGKRANAPALFNLGSMLGRRIGYRRGSN
jgi:hypothetical protein